MGFIAIVFVSVYQQIQPFTYTLILAAVGTIVSGQIMKFAPFIIGGVLLLLAAFICAFVPDELKVLVHGVGVVVGYIVPGYLLKNSKL